MTRWTKLIHIGWAVGYETVHFSSVTWCGVGDAPLGHCTHRERLCRVVHHTVMSRCHAKYSEAERPEHVDAIVQDELESRKFRDAHRFCPREPFGWFNKDSRGLRTGIQIKLNLTHVSAEARKEAKSLFFSQRTFVAEYPLIIDRWDSDFSCGQIIQQLHLEVMLKQSFQRMPSGDWYSFLAITLPHKFPQIKTLSVSLHLDGM